MSDILDQLRTWDALQQQQRQRDRDWMLDLGSGLFWNKRQGRWFRKVEPFGFGQPVEVYPNGSWRDVQGHIEQIHVDWDVAAAMAKWAERRCETCREELVLDVQDKLVPCWRYARPR